MTEETLENIAQAFNGEAKAYFRLQAFAEQAEAEGYPQMARLFRAVAKAEAVHARQHFSLLEKIKSTQENLQYCFEQEEFANRVAYPEFLRQAWAAQDQQAIWAFTSARNADERHAKLYKEALSHMVAERETVYFVCSHCGWVEDGHCPENCPNCQNPGDCFAEVR